MGLVLAGWYPDSGGIRSNSASPHDITEKNISVDGLALSRGTQCSPIPMRCSRCWWRRIMGLMWKCPAGCTAPLLLLLANHIGDLDTPRQAIALARDSAGG